MIKNITLYSLLQYHQNNFLKMLRINFIFINVATFFLSTSTHLNAQLYINEISANNETSIADAQGEYDDWIEIYNAGNTTVNLADHYFTDDLNNRTKWGIPATDATKTTIPANGYLLLWADEQITDGEDHVDFSLNSSGETVYWFNTDGTTLIDSLNYPSLSKDVSYGRSTDGNSSLQYFSASTPLAANASSVDVQIFFSETSQTFIGSLSVTLSTNANNGVLRYTTNGAEPTSNSSIYNGVITITGDVVLKVKYFFNNGIVSNTVTERYITMSSNANNISSDLPIILIDTYGQTLDENNMKNTFWSVIEPNNNGRAYATDPASYAGKAGMKIRGASSAGFTKKQWRVELRNEDDTDLKVDLLGMPADSDWVLYAPGRFDRALINNALMYELSRKLGYWAPRTRFVEVYYNSGNNLSSNDYWGVYILMEKINIDEDRVDIAKLKTTDNAGEELTGGYLFSLDRNNDFSTVYTQNYYTNPSDGFVLKEPDNNEITSMQLNYIYSKANEFGNALTSSNWLHPTLGYKNFTDIKTWMAPHILKALAKEPDGFHLSHYMYKDKNGLVNAGPVWDFDRALNSVDGRSIDPTGWYPVGSDGFQGNCHYWKPNTQRKGAFINEMVNDPDYETLFIDKWFEWRRDGVLKTSELNAIVDSMANVLNESQVRNFNKWNGIYYAPRYGGFSGEINALKNWLNNRTNWIDNQFIPSPSYSPLGGTVTANQNINIVNTYGGGTIYYTTDGTDPRLSGGATSSNASTYNGSFSITQPGITYITARIKSNNNWGAVCQIAFYVTDNYQDIVINEIHYNPTDVGLVDGDQFEFIELKNKSADLVNLTGLQFTDGIDYTFPAGSILPANGFIVLADDSLEFINQYGFSPDGNYGSNLSNAGEQIVLSDYYGNQLDNVIYDDASPWQINADGAGSSLALIDATADNNQAANWGIQNIPATPKAENTFCSGLLTFNTNEVNISCNGINDGFITGNASGGNAPYTYQWTNGATSNTISNLTAGTYTLTLTDAYNCAYIQSYQITEPNALTTNISSTDQSYYQTNDGTANVNVSGGTMPYTYNWSNGAATASVSNLAPGNYSVTVMDAQGCQIVEQFTIMAISCTPVQAAFTITNESGTNVNDGSIMVSPSGGTAPYTYNWSTGASSQNLSNVDTGNYSVTVTDANGCFEFFDQLVVANDCIASIVHQNNAVIASQIYQVGQFIQSNGIVNANEQVSFKAGDYIELTNDFEIIHGAEFEAVIDGCGQ